VTQWCIQFAGRNFKVCTTTLIIIFNIRKKFHMKAEDMFMVLLHNKFASQSPMIRHWLQSIPDSGSHGPNACVLRRPRLTALRTGVRVWMRMWNEQTGDWNKRWNADKPTCTSDYSPPGCLSTCATFNQTLGLIIKLQLNMQTNI
jgi:hypothetical protein